MPRPIGVAGFANSPPLCLRARRTVFFLAGAFFFDAFFFGAAFFLAAGLHLATALFFRAGFHLLTLFILRAGFFLAMPQVYQTGIKQAPCPNIHASDGR